MRAGTQAAGFGALAEFLDQLAKKVIQASHDINIKAMEISKITTHSVRTDLAREKYETAQAKASHAEFLASLSEGQQNISEQLSEENIDIAEKTKYLTRALEVLKQELDVGKVLASMSLVEASQAGKDFSAQLADNANNIASAIARIETNVTNSLQLIRKSKRK